MKRLFASLVVAGLFVGLLAGPVAAAGVQRQGTTTVYTSTDGSGHVWTLNFSCDNNSVVGTGVVGAAYGTPWTENITGTVANGNITFTATYVGWPGGAYWWSGTFPVGGGSFTVTDNPYFGGVFTLTAGATTSTYANHGAYVSANHGVDDAAHSCMGMPIVAQQ